MKKTQKKQTQHGYEDLNSKQHIKQDQNATINRKYNIRTIKKSVNQITS